MNDNGKNLDSKMAAEQLEKEEKKGARNGRNQASVLSDLID